MQNFRAVVESVKVTISSSLTQAHVQVLPLVCVKTHGRNSVTLARLRGARQGGQLCGSGHAPRILATAFFLSYEILVPIFDVLTILECEQKPAFLFKETTLHSQPREVKQINKYSHRTCCPACLPKRGGPSRKAQHLREGPVAQPLTHSRIPCLLITPTTLSDR